MSDDANVDRLVGELLSDEGYATGRRVFPRTVTPVEVIAVLARLHAEVDRGVEARAAAAARDNVAIACRRGCNACCAEPIMVLVPEAIAVAAWLMRPESRAVREAFVAAYPKWRAAVGDSLEKLAELDALGDRAAHTAAHIAHQRRHVLCPFNRGGDCTIYPVRPNICRNGHAIDTADYCGADHPSGKAATRLAFVPLDDFVRRVRRVERGLHLAVGGGPLRLAPLPDIVFKLIEGVP
jgi:hypothetical protein